MGCLRGAGGAPSSCGRILIRSRPRRTPFRTPHTPSPTSVLFRVAANGGLRRCAWRDRPLIEGAFTRRRHPRKRGAIPSATADLAPSQAQGEELGTRNGKHITADRVIDRAMALLEAVDRHRLLLHDPRALNREERRPGRLWARAADQESINTMKADILELLRRSQRGGQRVVVP